MSTTSPDSDVIVVSDSNTPPAPSGVSAHNAAAAEFLSERGHSRGGGHPVNRAGRGGGRASASRGRASNAGGGTVSCYVCGAAGHLGDSCPANKPVDAAAADPASVTPLGSAPNSGKIVEVYGDLMTASESLCHCVSACMAMGKGIAVLFNQRFGRIDELKAQHVGVGGVATLRDGDRRIYYLVTKPRYFHKPTYDTLRASLIAMRDDMRTHGITSIAMPELGCGLDGLQFPEVKSLIADVFAESGVTITIYHFKPAQQMWTRKGTYASKK